MYLKVFFFQIFGDEPRLGGGEALVQKWGQVSAGEGLTKFSPDGVPPPKKKKKNWFSIQLL